jgi:hypothetical protein
MATMITQTHLNVRYMYAVCLVSFQFLQIIPVKVHKPGDLAFRYKAFNTTTGEK